MSPQFRASGHDTEIENLHRRLLLLLDERAALREILEVGAAHMAASHALTAAAREALWSRLANVRVAPRTTWIARQLPISCPAEANIW
ncbi:hypothetical protein NGTWS1803_20000 [Mycolicibacterium cyprinidarum]|nr:hypothetical protein NGTWS1803_20000 [Mycolicibacterium sp. NGTWS1803]